MNNTAELPYGAPDPMMEELRSIRNEIQEILEPLSLEEQRFWFHEQARKELRSVGCDLFPHPDRPRAFKIQEVPH